MGRSRGRGKKGGSRPVPSGRGGGVGGGREAGLGGGEVQTIDRRGPATPAKVGVGGPHSGPPTKVARLGYSSPESLSKDWLGGTKGFCKDSNNSVRQQRSGVAWES